MPKTSIEIREPRLEEKERLQDFYRKIYRPDYPFLDDRFLLWWFNQNPLFERKDNFSCKIALDGDAIIGHFGFLPVAVWAEGGVYSGAWTGNFVVDQAYRGQGIGRKLARAIMSEFDVTLDIGANGAPYSLILVTGKPPLVMAGAYPYDAVQKLIDHALGD